METHLQRLVQLAYNKILGGKVIEGVEKLDHASTLAILAIHISFNVSPLFQLSTDNYLIEPILIEAAAELIESFPVCMLLDDLMKAVCGGRLLW
ncbi:7958_t:CDS:2 [Entrophospora sp. SA101]|nr:7958_t:CDS:2 [Entrophospora sp. SA101]